MFEVAELKTTGVFWKVESVARCRFVAFEMTLSCCLTRLVMCLDGSQLWRSP